MALAGCVTMPPTKHHPKAKSKPDEKRDSDSIGPYVIQFVAEGRLALACDLLREHFQTRSNVELIRRLIIDTAEDLKLLPSPH
jgi:hypothetical protein